MTRTKEGLGLRSLMPLSLRKDQRRFWAEDASVEEIDDKSIIGSDAKKVDK